VSNGLALVAENGVLTIIEGESILAGSWAPPRYVADFSTDETDCWWSNLQTDIMYEKLFDFYAVLD
jgi:hypothetical protein